MKKLLALVMVLGLASMASALTVSITGPDKLMPGEAAMYSIDYSGGAIVAFDMTVDLSNALAALTGATLDAAGRNTAYDAIYLPEIAGSSDGAVLGTHLCDVEITAGDQLGTFDIGLTDVGHFDDSWNQVVPEFAGMGVEIVPEPITMTLLGLGGLVAIRRRRA